MKLMVISIYDGSPYLSVLENGSININVPEEVRESVKRTEKQDGGFYLRDISGKITEHSERLLARLHELGYAVLVCENGDIEFFGE